MKSKLLTLGNHKLDKHIAIFNLPRGETCPGKTAVCYQYCYAKKPEVQYGPNGAPMLMRHRNLAASKTEEFIQDIIAELKSHPKVTKCRVHEAGDFYSQAYLDKWIAIARAVPGITFLAYTKSAHLDYSAAPENMKIYFSTDSSTSKADYASMLQYSRPLAHLVLKGEVIPAGYVTCVHTDTEHYCGRQCFSCWVGKANVYFAQH